MKMTIGKFMFMLAVVFVMICMAPIVKAAEVIEHVNMPCNPDKIEFLADMKKNGYDIETTKSVMLGDTYEQATQMTATSKQQRIRLTVLVREKSACVLSAEYYDQKMLLDRFKNFWK